MRAVARFAVFTVAIAGTGCKAFAPSHVLNFETTTHWWHQVPAFVGFVVAIVPASIVAFPIMFVEECVGVDSVYSDARESSDPAPLSGCTVAVLTGGFAYLVALPFVVIGLPFEGERHAAPSARTPEAPLPAEPSDTPPGNPDR